MNPLTFLLILEGGTLPPQPLEEHESSAQIVNRQLVCTHEIHILSVSINEAKAHDGSGFEV